MQSSITFGYWLKQRRLLFDLTQEALADAAACSVSYIRKFESGARRPSRQIAISLADVLKVPHDLREAIIQLALLNDPSLLVTHAHNPEQIPAPPNSLIGRESDLASVTMRLQAADLRLLTLIGPPGVGKTRLATEAARRYAGETGVHAVLVELAALGDHQLVLPTIARAFGVRAFDESGLLDALAQELRSKPTLLVLDNCEHVLDAAAQVATLLARCPLLRVLATSRVALRLRAERRYVVAPLALPATSATAAAIDAAPAVMLFAERAEAVAPDFRLVAETRRVVAAICAQLDGLPLALELAAARIDELALPTLLSQLERRLPLLAGGPRDLPARQQTLRDAIGWSFDSLPALEQHEFALLGVFAGSFDAAAASAIGVSRLAELVHKSLVQSDGGSEPRYRLLETLREYALEQLSPEQVADARQRHAAYFAQRASTMTDEYLGEVAWLHQSDLDVANYRAAMEWSLEHDGGLSGAQILIALVNYFNSRGAFMIDDRWLTLLAQPHDTVALSAKLHARAAYAVGYLRSQHGDTSGRSLYLFQHSRNIAEIAGDELTAARALLAMGMMMRYPGNSANALLVLEQAHDLAKKLGNQQLLGQVNAQLGMCYTEWAHYSEAAQAFERASDHERLAGRTMRIINLLPDRAEVALRQGKRADAQALFHEAIVRGGEIGSRIVVAEAEMGLGIIAALDGDWSQAQELIERSFGVFQQVNLYYIARLTYLLAVIALRSKHFERARELFTKTLQAALDTFSVENMAHSLLGLAVLDAYAGDLALAAARLGAANAICERFSCREEYFEPMLRTMLDQSLRSTTVRAQWRALATQAETFLRAALPTVEFASATEAWQKLYLSQHIERAVRETVANAALENVRG